MKRRLTLDGKRKHLTAPITTQKDKFSALQPQVGQLQHKFCCATQPLGRNGRKNCLQKLISAIPDVIFHPHESSLQTIQLLTNRQKYPSMHHLSSQHTAKQTLAIEVMCILTVALVTTDHFKIASSFQEDGCLTICHNLTQSVLLFYKELLQALGAEAQQFVSCCVIPRLFHQCHNQVKNLCLLQKFLGWIGMKLTTNTCDLQRTLH